MAGPPMETVKNMPQNNFACPLDRPGGFLYNKSKATNASSIGALRHTRRPCPCSRFCRFPLLSLPASVASRFCRFPLLSLLCLSLCSLFAVNPRPAAAQAQGYWQTGWTIKDQAGNIVPMNSDRSYSLATLPTGSASNTYPKVLTQQALASPYNNPAGGKVLAVVDKSDYIDCYRPNALDARRNPGLSYLFGGTPPPRPLALLSLDGFAANYAVGTYTPAWFTYFFPYDYPDPRSSQYLPVVGSSHAEAKGTLLLRFVYTADWIGSGTPTAKPMPPPYLKLLLSTSLKSSATISFTDTLIGNDGFGGRTASATVSAPYFKEVSSAQASSGGAKALLSQIGQPVRGYHLVRAAVQNGIAEVFVDGQVTVDASSPLASNDFDEDSVAPYVSHSTSEGSATLTATAGQDGREVTVSCPTIETSYHKGAVDSLHPTGRWENIRALDGSMKGDAAAKYSIADSDQAWVANASFNANTPGFTNPLYSWSSDFNPAKMLGVSLTQASISGSWFLYSAEKLPVVKTVRLDVQDGPTTVDHATAANTYSVNWHLPYEPTDYIGQTAIGKHIEQTIASGVYPSASYDIAAAPAKDFDVSAAFDVGEAVTALSGQEEAAGLFKIASSIAKVTNAKYSYGGDKPSTGNRNDGASWSVAYQDKSDNYGGGNIFPTLIASDPDGWMNCKLSWCVVSKWRENSWHADKYTVNGYDSPNHVLVVHTTDLVDEEPYFVQYKNSNGTPYNP